MFDSHFQHWLVHNFSSDFQCVFDRHKFWSINQFPLFAQLFHVHLKHYHYGIQCFWRKLCSICSLHLAQKFAQTVSQVGSLNSAVSYVMPSNLTVTLRSVDTSETPISEQIDCPSYFPFCWLCKSFLCQHLKSVLCNRVSESGRCWWNRLTFVIFWITVQNQRSRLDCSWSQCRSCFCCTFTTSRVGFVLRFQLLEDLF